MCPNWPQDEGLFGALKHFLLDGHGPTNEVSCESWKSLLLPYLCWPFGCQQVRNEWGEPSGGLQNVWPKQPKAVVALKGDGETVGGAG